jgi:hypothetical protein
MTNNQNFYIVKREDGHCDIITDEQMSQEKTDKITGKWGPIATQQEAIARKIGLIRAGKCQPQ